LVVPQEVKPRSVSTSLGSEHEQVCRVRCRGGGGGWRCTPARRGPLGVGRRRQGFSEHTGPSSVGNSQTACHAVPNSHPKPCWNLANPPHGSTLPASTSRRNLGPPGVHPLQCPGLRGPTAWLRTCRPGGRMAVHRLACALPASSASGLTGLGRRGFVSSSVLVVRRWRAGAQEPLSPPGPQRVEPERWRAEAAPTSAAPRGDRLPGWRGRRLLSGHRRRISFPIEIGWTGVRSSYRGLGLGMGAVVVGGSAAGCPAGPLPHCLQDPCRSCGCPHRRAVAGYRCPQAAPVSACPDRRCPPAAPACPG
jgi:hypothetical protein